MWAEILDQNVPHGEGGKWGRHGATASSKVGDMRSDAQTTRRPELNRRLRLAFLAGAEARSRQTVGRGLTDEELQRVIAQYPGDVPDR